MSIIQPNNNNNQTIQFSSIANKPHLTKQQQIFLTCYFCFQSQQQCQSDMLLDSKCHLFHTCYECFLQNKHISMQQCSCKLKLKDHIKYKNTKKEYILDQGTKLYEKQQKTRSYWLEGVDQQMVDLLVYYYRNGKGNEYLSKQREIKNILKQLKKNQNKIYGDLKKLKLQFINRQNNDQTGKEACGYVSNYQKGLKFLYDAFGG